MWFTFFGLSLPIVFYQQEYKVLPPALSNHYYQSRALAPFSVYSFKQLIAVPVAKSVFSSGYQKIQWMM